MKKFLPLIAALLVCTFAVEGSKALIPALIMSVVIIISVLLAVLVSSLLKKQLLGASYHIAAAILGAFFADAITILMAAFAYKMFTSFTWQAAVIASAVIAASAAIHGEDELKKAVQFCCSFAVCTIVLAIIRELFGSAAIAGAEISVLKAFSNTALVKASGGFIVLAIIMACVRKLLPAETNSISLGKLLPFRLSSKLADKSIPEAFRGVPVMLLTIGLICMAVFAYL